MPRWIGPQPGAPDPGAGNNGWAGAGWPAATAHLCFPSKLPSPSPPSLRAFSGGPSCPLAGATHSFLLISSRHCTAAAWSSRSHRGCLGPRPLARTMEGGLRLCVPWSYTHTSCPCICGCTPHGLCPYGGGDFVVLSPPFLQGGPSSFPCKVWKGPCPLGQACPAPFICPHRGCDPLW